MAKDKNKSAVKKGVVLGEGEVIVIAVKGRPKPQPRPRMLKSGVVVSTADADAKQWRERVRGAARRFIQDRYGFGEFCGYAGALRADMIFSLPLKDASRHGEFCTSKPDKDNLEKMVLDGLEGSGLFAVGDQQVVQGEVAKVWSAERDAGVVVRISPPRKTGANFEAGADAVRGAPDSRGGLFGVDVGDWLG